MLQPTADPHPPHHHPASPIPVATGSLLHRHVLALNVGSRSVIASAADALSRFRRIRKFSNNRVAVHERRYSERAASSPDTRMWLR